MFFRILCVAVLLCGLFVDSSLAEDASADPQHVDPKQASPVVIPGTRQFSLFSTEHKKEYRILVGEPKEEPPANGFPVVYILDGNATFGTLLDASRRAQKTLGPMVVVGIGYPTEATIDSQRRTYDFVPAPTAEFLANLPRKIEAKAGGQAEFIKFIEQDLKPTIEKTYAINKRQQALIGHSFGGLFVLHLLYTQPESFQSYIALSPSIWWADMQILSEERTFREQRGRRADLLIAVGGREKEHMIDDARDMVDRLKVLSGDGLRVTYKEFPEEDHGSVVAAAIGAALRFSQEAGPR